MPFMNCPSCAAAVPDDSRCCSACGEAVPVEPEVQRLRREVLLLQEEVAALRKELRKIQTSRLWQAASVYWEARRRVDRLLRIRPNAAPAEPGHPPGKSSAEVMPGSAIERVSERFASFRHPENRGFFDALVRHLASLEKDPCLPMYFEFAITANERGEKVAELLSRRFSLAGKNYLDIGCAYAGFLVAFARRGANVVGIDIDQQLLALAEVNLKDAGIDARLYRRDATRAEDLSEFRDTFDVVTANDVIEHVGDPGSLLRNIAGALRRGGIAYLEIPNRDAVPFVREDGHYKLFGITLLEHPEAERYYALHAPGVPYGVGHYLELADYGRLFAEAGLRFEVLKENAGERTVRRIEEDAEQLRCAFDERRRTVPEPLRELVTQRVQSYLEELDRSPRRSNEDRVRFVERYGTGFWRVIGTKR
jgi:2-polyprenyl-3-methyl-5-hydroxy-6-metoxy-1,4-benzoquinol methylase/predicted nucleic acid-binding Zn ribbon protein